PFEKPVKRASLDTLPMWPKTSKRQSASMRQTQNGVRRVLLSIFRLSFRDPLFSQNQTIAQRLPLKTSLTYAAISNFCSVKTHRKKVNSYDQKDWHSTRRNSHRVSRLRRNTRSSFHRLTTSDDQCAS